MKKTLLSFSLIGCVLFGNAQNLPLNQSFNAAGSPAGWTFFQADVESYSALNPTCITDRGIVTGPSVSSNGNNTVGFLTQSLEYISKNSVVTAVVDLYGYDKNKAECANQDNEACGIITLKAFLVKDSYSGSQPAATDIYGESPAVMVGAAGKNIPVSATVNPQSVPGNNTSFKLLFIIKATNCSGGGNKIYVIDNVRIGVVDNIPLPVNFKAFNAIRINNSSVGVQWTTASEQNNKGFYVQRNDGEGWKNIAFVFSKTDDGNSTVEQSYSFNDANQINGVSQYRIMQIDLDGKAKYSSIRSIRGDGLVNKTLVFPNPTKTGNINIIFENASAKKVLVSDASGRVVKSYPNELNSVEVTGLKKGFYTLQIIDRKTNDKKLQKIIVQ